MSTLHKVFVILLSVTTFVQAGMIATLFGMRADWKDKFTRSANSHVQTVKQKDGEISSLTTGQTNLLAYVNMLETQSKMLNQELASSKTINADLQRGLDYLKGQFDKSQADGEVMLNLVQTYKAQLQEYDQKIKETEGQYARVRRELQLTMSESHGQKARADGLEKSLATLEELHTDLARMNRRHEETLQRLHERGVNVSAAPRRPIDGKVKAVAAELGVVIISVGQKDEVQVGDQFTIYRGTSGGGQFVTEIVIDEVQSTFSSGHVILKSGIDPEAGDDASNHIKAGGFSAGQNP